MPRFMRKCSHSFSLGRLGVDGDLSKRERDDGRDMLREQKCAHGRALKRPSLAKPKLCHPGTKAAHWWSSVLVVM